MKTHYTINHGKTVARFSSLRHALLFGEMLSRDELGLIEVSAKSGLVGQYQSGRPTPEFEMHHVNGIFR